MRGNNEEMEDIETHPTSKYIWRTVHADFLWLTVHEVVRWGRGGGIV